MSKVRKQPHEQHEKADICGARTRKGTICRNPQGFRTPHFGRGRCYLHGGLSTGPPKGNKNAVKTGFYETIWFDTLDPEEQELYRQIQVDKVAQVDQELRLLEIRERRMMKRIEKLRHADPAAGGDEGGFTVVEQEEVTNVEDGKTTKRVTEKRRGILGQIQDIEEALTRVQAQKVRLIEAKHKIESELPPAAGDIEGYKKALRGEAKEVWADEGDEIEAEDEGTADEA